MLWDKRENLELFSFHELASHDMTKYLGKFASVPKLA